MLRWVSNLITLQEKRAFHGETVVLFATFVAAMRLLLELFLVGYHEIRVASDMLVYASWYALCFFAFGLPVRLLAPAPWERRINVVLVGLFLGITPPIIDVLAGGWGEVVVGDRGFSYSYIRNFPEGWAWSMVDPERQMPLGEGLALWGATLLTGTYLWLRTRSAWRAGLGLAIAYLTCMFMGAVLPTLTFWLRERYWSDVKIDVLLVSSQLVTLLLVYFVAYRASVGRLIAARFVHALPLIGVALVGYAWIRPLDFQVLHVLLVVSLCGVTTIVQNDHWDDLEERPDEPPRVAPYDLVVVHFTWVVMTLLLYAHGSVLAVPTTIYGVASYLYNSPLYRGKRYVPANLKLEGLWGGSAFMLGVLAAAMPQLADLGAARDGARLTSTMERLPFSWRYGPDVAVAALLAFGGWSLLASLKDEKDVETDAQGGVQTLFTLARRRNVSAPVVARAVRGVALACLLIAAWAPLAIGRSDLVHAVVMTVLAVAIALYRGSVPSTDFRARLVGLSVLLVVLANGVSTTAAPAEARRVDPTPRPASSALEPITGGTPASTGDAGLPALDETMTPREALERLGARESAVARSDYGRAVELDGPFLEISPTSVLDVQSAVRQARREGMAIRVRGRGHSTNGGSVARAGELSIVTTRMRRICRTTEESVTVDAGVAVVHVDRFLAPFGLRLRVSNDGPPGPSVGGYVSAGGFGSLSSEFGGLWSQARSVTLVDGTGAARTLTPADEAFRWLFGSVGQLGVIVSAEMNVTVVPAPGVRPFPVGDCASIPSTRAEEHEGFTPVHSWWTLMVEPARFEEARDALAQIQARHASGLHWVEPYRYAIVHRDVYAPLVTPVAGDVVACGIWIVSTVDEHRAARSEIDRVEAEVEAMARAHGFRRYLSAERSVGPDVWRRNLGEETYDRFRVLKASFDPDHLFGRGVVFEPPTP